MAPTNDDQPSQDAKVDTKEQQPLIVEQDDELHGFQLTMANRSTNEKMILMILINGDRMEFNPDPDVLISASVLLEGTSEWEQKINLEKQLKEIKFATLLQSKLITNK
jgi:hypothetical protein